MRTIFAFATLVLVAVPSTANAQLAPGRSGISTQQTFGGQMAWDVLVEFGNCYASREQAKALELVSTPAGSLEEAKIYKRLFRKADQGCLGDISSLSVPWQLVRGAVAEGFYQKRIQVPANLTVTTPMLPENALTLSDIATCYVARNPDPARVLVETTRPGTKKEFEAVSALMPGMAECLPANLPKAPQFDTMLIRFRIAEALWRLGMVRSESGPVATKANP